MSWASKHNFSADSREWKITTFSRHLHHRGKSKERQFNECVVCKHSFYSGNFNWNKSKTPKRPMWTINPIHFQLQKKHLTYRELISQIYKLSLNVNSENICKNLQNENRTHIQLLFAQMINTILYRWEMNT